MSAGIIHFNGNLQDLKNEIRQAKGLVVVDFFATWCGPCQRLGQILPTIAEANKDVTFIKVDVDQNGPVAEQFGVSSIPQINFVKPEGEDYKVLDTIIGADVAKIKANIEKFK
ncbi:Thioredoxin family protein [Trichomonas vaginalis G3]|uniref:Thioredoxin n=1 Tax=Trichomonas vaginalis (strain ATCC PRA-98 / G3) TaxID=412133 RepID=A2EFR4_TRIV3|nr:cell redox homeostasis [Trichomonas vaginalis G3]EAY08465.1 Thioredoxin family protein [Trichomonas vaginalis G3]KAI5537778.1 cell redox homeostasis [Trichomonas vaginalis G3]|eukprot:XP_001320688.1 Thioredoxin family protein [Trichomonas vaginalis G3]